MLFDGSVVTAPLPPAGGLVQDFFCGVRRYVALACRASYEDARNRRRGHIIASESFGLGEVPYRLIGKRFPNQVLSGFAVYQALGLR
jgi:hypothetical protein